MRDNVILSLKKKTEVCACGGHSKGRVVKIYTELLQVYREISIKIQVGEGTIKERFLDVRWGERKE